VSFKTITGGASSTKKSFAKTLKTITGGASSTRRLSRKTLKRMVHTEPTRCSLRLSSFFKILGVEAEDDRFVRISKVAR
jgi:hypothetical protein